MAAKTLNLVPLRATKRECQFMELAVTVPVRELVPANINTIIKITFILDRVL